MVAAANNDVETQKKELDYVKLERDELNEISCKLEKELEDAKQSINNFVEQVFF